MAGKGTFSPHQTPQHGDKVAIERLKTNTSSPMSGAPMERRGAGRPPGADSPASPQTPGMSPDERRMIGEIPQALKVLQYWQAVNAALDTPDTRLMLADAQRDFERVSGQLKNNTPNWDI